MRVILHQLYYLNLHKQTGSNLPIFVSYTLVDDETESTVENPGNFLSGEIHQTLSVHCDQRVKENKQETLKAGTEFYKQGLIDFSNEQNKQCMNSAPRHPVTQVDSARAMCTWPERHDVKNKTQKRRLIVTQGLFSSA